jgi:23S rRNA (cytosine1962-C5)-methyltransferase
MRVVQLELAKGLSRHVKAGHPWIFAKALVKPPKLPPGSVVDVVENGRFVARGYYDPLSPIAVRVLTLDPRDTIDERFFARRISQALSRREALLDLDGTDAFRLIHGEGDGLPGLILDKYGSCAVLKLYSAGLNPYRSLILESVRAAVPSLTSVVGRDEIGRDDAPEEAAGKGRVLWGAPPPPLVEISERGVRFKVDVFSGQKTGFFLDQRENRFLIRRLSKDKEVLNCFCYTGGFSVNAARGGAKSVFSVDLDDEAIALARENFSLNGEPPERHDFLAADVFELLSSFKKEGRTFDLIILDPPAFAKSQKAVAAAIDGYAALNRQALALLRPGGLLATASCSARVSAADFLGAVHEAAVKTGAELGLVEERHQPADHPIRLGFPEGRYLKFFIFQDAR